MGSLMWDPFSAPAFVDVDNDGNTDLVIGRSAGDLKFMYDPSFCTSCNNQGTCEYNRRFHLRLQSGQLRRNLLPCAPGYSSQSLSLPIAVSNSHTVHSMREGYWNSETSGASRKPAPLDFSNRMLMHVKLYKMPSRSEHVWL